LYSFFSHHHTQRIPAGHHRKKKFKKKKKIVSNFKPLEWGSSGSKHPPKSKNKCGSANYKQFFDMCKVPCFVVEFVLLVCWKRNKEQKVGNLLGIL
jgi:hypothetical protein